MNDIFISHVEEDADVALEITLGLEEAGYSTWYYELDGIPGTSYLLQTGEAVANSKAVVVVISPHSVGSRQVTREVVRAHESDKDFIPVRRGISHIEFQNRQPEWREAIGAATSISIPKEGAASVLPRIIAGLKSLGVQPAVKADSARIEQIRKALGELLVSTQGVELEHSPAGAEKGTADLAVHVETPVKGLKRVTNLRWFLIAGVLLCLGFYPLILLTAEYSPLAAAEWYEAFLGMAIVALIFIAPGAYCLRRGITQSHSSKPSQGNISGWWWLLPIFLGPIGGIIAWLKQRDVDWRKASNLLTLGIVLSVLWTIPFLAAK